MLSVQEMNDINPKTKRKTVSKDPGDRRQGNGAGRGGLENSQDLMMVTAKEDGIDPTNMEQ